MLAKNSVLNGFLVSMNLFKKYINEPLFIVINYQQQLVSDSKDNETITKFYIVSNRYSTFELAHMQKSEKKTNKTNFVLHMHHVP